MTTRTRAPGLDGVRALAVLAVIGFHEGASGLPGGFLGVDIFFVLSGFLITDLLIAGYDRDGRPGLKDFWGRRARRLLPALAVMLLVVTAAAAIIEPRAEASLRLALLAAATYTSNWYQILHRVPYFAASAQFGAPPPLDHLWSLAIEEQFYLLWPLILLFVIVRLTKPGARVAATLLGAAASALAMALLYTPGSDPSAVYYGTGTHAFALLIGAALALARPLATLTSAPAEQSKRLDAAGVVGLIVLAWAIGHFSGSDPVVYPVGLILAALGAAGLVAAAAGHGVIAAITSWGPLRWVGIRSYGIYLWHWPVIALGAALAGSGSASPWLWLLEIGITIAVAAASWRFIETPILENGLRATFRHWWRVLVDAIHPVGPVRRPVPVIAAATAAVVFLVACYGIARPPAAAAPSGLLRQVANGQRVSSASQLARAGASSSPAASGSAAAPRPSPSHPVCRRGQPRVSGGQVTAVGDSVMLASATALDAAMPGVYIDAQVGRQVQPGLSVVQTLAAEGSLRPIVVVGLGTNGPITAGQIRELRRIIGPDRELVLVNTFGPQPWEHVSNASLDAARYDKHTELADWDRAIAGHPALLWPDGIHPDPAGARLYARVVLAAIRAGLPSTC